MTRLPVISGRRCVAALGKAGFRFVHQVGSHIILKREQPASRISVPDHRELDRGTLLRIIRAAGLTKQEFLEILKKRP